jgi:MSHA biogenesis protein MshL
MKKFIALYTVILLLLSCSTIPTATNKTIDEAFSSSAAFTESEKKHTPPTAVTDALIPDFNQTLLTTQDKPSPTQFNISLHEVDAREFFMGLVVDTDENMLVHPDVSGLISLELKNVTVAQVMDAVQKVYGYDYKKNDIGYMVYPATLHTRIFKLNRLDLTREGLSNTRVSSGQISDANMSSETDVFGQSNATNDKDPSNTSGSWINTRTSTDFWQEIETALISIITIDPDATVVLNRSTGVIVVRAKPMQQREVENFIDITQKQIGRQVILEAKIIEIILDDSHQDGVNWHSIVRDVATKLPLVSGIAPLGVGFTDIFTIAVTSGDFAAYIELMQSQGKTNILSSPKVSTLNNQKAIIKVGRDEYFVTDVSSDTIATGSSTIVNPELTWTPFFSGIALDVTPQINDHDEIMLHIHPSVTRVVNQDKRFILNGEEGSLPMALNTVRESDSIISAKNGQIVVIGGLMQETTRESKRGISGLASLPYIGNLFRVNKGETRKTELIILLKATIINC